MTPVTTRSGDVKGVDMGKSSAEVSDSYRLDLLYNVRLPHNVTYDDCMVVGTLGAGA
jgi:hypothetical protein